MTFHCVFRFLTKKHKEKSLKVDVFSVSFGLKFEDEGAKKFYFLPFLFLANSRPAQPAEIYCYDRVD